MKMKMKRISLNFLARVGKDYRFSLCSSSNGCYRMRVYDRNSNHLIVEHSDTSLDGVLYWVADALFWRKAQLQLLKLHENIKNINI